MSTSTDAITRIYEDQTESDRRPTGNDPGQNGQQRRGEISASVPPMPRPEGTANAEVVNVNDHERLISGITGGTLATIGLIYGIKNKSPLAGLALGLAGASLIYRGTTGHCEVYKALGVSTTDGVPPTATSNVVQEAVTINKSPEELYQYWHDYANLAQFMTHLESVTDVGQNRSRWVAKAPLGKTVEWLAETTADVPNQRIAWQSLPDADVDNRGEVRFVPAPGGRGTEVHVRMEYNPPGGKVGSVIAGLLGEEPHQQVYDDLRHFKQIMETGQIATTDNQPSGPRSLKGTLFQKKEVVA